MKTKNKTKSEWMAHAHAIEKFSAEIVAKHLRLIYQE